jgi:DHA2 family multidrug resistance protein-like MFS transporter
MTDETRGRVGRREWVGLSVLALACVVYSMDLTVLHLAVPSLSADLKPSSAQLLWIVDIYGFMVAGALAAFSTSAERLIASRALLGIAGATIAPSTLSLIRDPCCVNVPAAAAAIY